MMQCPICRAQINGADTCRRCRTELKQVQDVERQGSDLLGAAMHLLALGNTAVAARLLRRARVVHATPEVRLLWRMATASQRTYRTTDAASVVAEAARHAEMEPEHAGLDDLLK
jgi:hypothetical protein